MKCFKCGAEISNDANFCSKCGAKIADCLNNSQFQETTYIPTVHDEEVFEADTPKETLVDKIKIKLITTWKSLDLFCKIATIGAIIILYLLLISISIGKSFAIFFSVFQIIALIAAVLMHKKIIKLEAKKDWIKYLALAVAIFLTILNIFSYSWETTKPSSKPSAPPSASNSSYSTSSKPLVTTAQSPYDVDECVEQNYSDIKSRFVSAGFTNIKVEKVEDLKLSESDKIDTVESITIGGKSDFSKGEEFKKSEVVLIRYHAYKKCNVTIHIDFYSNLLFCKYDVNFIFNGVESGTMEHGTDKDFTFTVDPGEYTLLFENDESSDVKGEIALNVDCDIEAEYRITCYSDKISVEKVYVDRLEELETGQVKVDVAASEYKYKNYKDVETALKKLGFTNIKYNILYDIIWGWTENGEVDSVSIAGKKDFTRGDVFPENAEIIITYHMPEEDDPSRIKMEKGSDAYDGMNYKDAEKLFKDMGFTNVQLGKVTTEDKSHKDGEVFLIEIGGWTFDADETFSPDDKVYIKYYSLVEPEPEGPVFYSTNDYETAKKGNTGVFSYRQRGGSYDIYWIIDFDEGYVYYFTDGNGESFCDRLKIDSGTLNDKIIITYHDGNYTWSHKLHFKYVNHPETLIMVDDDGFEHEYSTTDLDKALALRATKKIKDY